MMEKFLMDYTKFKLSNKYLFHIINWSEVFFALLIIRALDGSEINVNLVIDSVIIYLVVFMIAILPLGGRIGIMKKLSKNKQNTYL